MTTTNGVDLDALRVTDAPELTDAAEVYEVTEPDERNPEWPVRYRLDVTFEGHPVLSCDQPGPFLVPSGTEEMTIDLETLVKLGEIASAILARR